MPLQLTGTSSRVTKSARRSSSSPFSLAKRKKPGSQSLKKTESSPAKLDASSEIKLEDYGLLDSLVNDISLSDVVQQIRWVVQHQWCAIPEKAAGMNSTRIAEVLNFRRRMPPLVSVHHIHSMSRYPTATEREIGKLVAAGIIRRVILPPRETGSSSVGEALVLVEEWERRVMEHPSLDQDLKDKYVKILRDPGSAVVLNQQDIASLTLSGFLTESARSQARVDMFLKPSTSNLGTLQAVSSAGSAYASGSTGAVAQGSTELQHIAGGHGPSRRISNALATRISAKDKAYNLTLPNTGSYLKVLISAREHLISILSKNNRFREAPRELLEERWDGGTAGTDEVTRAQQLRGDWIGVLPGRTKKWKQFYGLNFQWVLAECVGAGLVECFNTGSVGVGVRVV